MSRWKSASFFFIFNSLFSLFSVWLLSRMWFSICRLIDLGNIDDHVVRNKSNSSKRSGYVYFFFFTFVPLPVRRSVSRLYNGTKNTAVSLQFIPFDIFYFFALKYRGVIISLFFSVSNVACSCSPNFSYFCYCISTVYIVRYIVLSALGDSFPKVQWIYPFQYLSSLSLSFILCLPRFGPVSSIPLDAHELGFPFCITS